MVMMYDNDNINDDGNGFRDHFTKLLCRIRQRNVLKRVPDTD